MKKTLYFLVLLLVIFCVLGCKSTKKKCPKSGHFSINDKYLSLLQELRTVLRQDLFSC